MHDIFIPRRELPSDNQGYPIIDFFIYFFYFYFFLFFIFIFFNLFFFFEGVMNLNRK